MECIPRARKVSSDPYTAIRSAVFVENLKTKIL
jgi:hypothetical protein